jgi:feruloyl esterase
MRERLRSVLSGLVCGALAAAGASLAAAADETQCAAFAEPGLFEDAAVDAASWIVATDALPAHCEIAATASPVEGSAIGMVYRLPETWNGKTLGLGGGGFSGDTSLRAAADGLARGYATMQTDTGHPLPASPMGVMNASWAMSDDGQPNWVLLEDFGHRAIHVMTELGHAVAARYYGRARERAYFLGCSTGGRQGMLETQRYPTDYDGVIAGAPILDLTIQSSGFLRGRLFSEAPERRLSQAQLASLNAAIVAACDPPDGVVDGVVSDETLCAFDPAELLCAADAPSATCLTPAQADAVRTLYEGIAIADGRVAAWGLMPGSETSWGYATGGPGDPVMAQAKGAALFFGGPLDEADATPEVVLDRLAAAPFDALQSAGDPDLTAFVAAGGKLILHHGTLDALANPLATIDYYERLLATTGPRIEGDVADHARLFVLPGTGHCGGGPGANTADWLGALEAWVEEGLAPDSILARRVASPFGPPPAADASELVRPLCAYPARARYRGGDPNRAESFACE